MISSNILHRQFLSICSSHRKHCKEGAAATALCPLPYSDAVMKLGTDSISSSSQHLNSTACEPGITLSIHTQFFIYSSQTTHGTTRGSVTCPRLCTVKLQRKEKQDSPTAPHSLAGATGSPHPSTFLLECWPQKWRKWKRAGEKLPLPVSQDCLAETQGQRAESLPATPTGWNAIPSHHSCQWWEPQHPPEKRRGTGHHPWPPPLHPLLQGAQCRNLESPSPFLRPQSHQSCQFRLLISLSHKLSSVLTKFH